MTGGGVSRLTAVCVRAGWRRTTCTTRSAPVAHRIDRSQGQARLAQWHAAAQREAAVRRQPNRLTIQAELHDRRVVADCRSQQRPFFNEICQDRTLYPTDILLQEDDQHYLAGAQEACHHDCRIFCITLAPATVWRE